MSVSKRVGFTATAVTQVHGKAHKLRSRRCQHCHQSFTPRRATAKFCSSNCRVKAHKARHQPQERRRAPVIRMHSTCAHCGASFQARSGRGQVYCSGSCKTLAYRARRAALIDAIAAYTGAASAVAADSVEKHGMKRASAILRALGVHYDPKARVWRGAVPERLSA